MPKYICEHCEKEFMQKCHYINHLNKKFSCKNATTKNHQGPTKIPPNTTDQNQNIVGQIHVPHQCKYCGGNFSRKDSLNRHIDSRCPVKKEDDSVKEKLLQKLIQQLEEKDKKLEEKDKQIDSLLTRFENIEKKLNATKKYRR